jgi:regulator of sirC expression with transglutaminase-like and TPR domain
VEAAWVLFAHIAQRSEEDIDLGAAGLLIAEAEYPGLDVAHYLSVLDSMAEGGRSRAARELKDDDEDGKDPLHLLRALNQHLFEDLGFRGNQDDYYDPKNSFLNEVIDRRVGIPITLSVVYMEVGRRLGLPLEGVSFPGHFLVKYKTPEGDLLLDPYHGGVALSRAELEQRLERAFGKKTSLAPTHLQTASKRQILTRMLNNLRGIYQQGNDPSRERGVLERLAILNPQDERVGEALAVLRRGRGEVN